MSSFVWNINKIHSIPDGFFSPGILWFKRVLYPHDPMNTKFANMDLDYFESFVGPKWAEAQGVYQHCGIPLATGRLAQVIEGSGKRRIFAICNYIKQRLLRPVHDWAMKILASIPMDGTFDQGAPIRRLQEKGHLVNYCFDLKSATDRWPLSVMYTLMSMMRGPTLASSIVNSSLGLNTFLVMNPIVQKMREVAFIAGQPLGFYGSWSLFSLCHHYLVWLAAEKAGVRHPFRDYALLGDNIVISNERVAQEYSQLLEKLGVTISINKSTISRNGSIEFAKRFLTKGRYSKSSPVVLLRLTR